jgi:hypothetical protein
LQHGGQRHPDGGIAGIAFDPQFGGFAHQQRLCRRIDGQACRKGARRGIGSARYAAQSGGITPARAAPRSRSIARRTDPVQTAFRERHRDFRPGRIGQRHDRLSRAHDLTNLALNLRDDAARAAP